MNDESPVRVLVIDDSDAQRNTIVRALQKSGIDVQEAATEEQALGLAVRNIDVILLNANPPGMNGIAVYRQLNANQDSSHIPVIELSEHRTKGILESADDYLVKPVSVEELVGKIRAWARIRRAESGLIAKNKELEEALRSAREEHERREIAESKLNAANVLLSSVLGSITDAFLVLDRNWRFAYVNQEAARAGGRQPEELIGEDAWEMFPADIHLKARFEEIIRSGKPDHLEVFSNVTQSWLSMNAYPTADGGLSLLWRDITERQQENEALRRSESEARARAAELSAILDAVPALTFIAHDPECQWVSSSRTAHDLLRVPLGRTISLTAAQGERPENFRVYRDNVEIPPTQLPMQVAAAQGREVWSSEFTAVFDDGTVLDLLGNAVPLFDEAGKSRGSVGAFVDITERKRAERALAEVTAQSEKRKRLYETVLSNTPDLVYVFDLNHRFTYANESLLRMWGRTWDEAIGKNCLELGYEPWHAEMHDREIEQVIATKKPIRGEVPFSGTYGRRIYDYIFVPVLAEDGSVEAVAGTTRDVTEKTESEQRIRESEERLRAFVNASSDAVYRMSADWQELRQLEGRGFLTSTDTSAPKLNWLPEYLPSHECDRVSQAIQTAIRNKSVYQLEHQVRRTDGSLGWTLSKAIPILDKDGQILEWFGTASDVTARKEAEQALRESEERFRATFEQAAVGIAHVGLDGTWVRVNRRYCDILGYEPEELLKLRFQDVTHPEDLDLDVAHAQELIEGVISTYSMHKRYFRKDGSNVWVNLTVSLVRNEDGKPHYFISVAEDITEQKKAEEALIRSEKLASVGRMAATIAHEINNPLAAVTNAVFIARVSGELNAAGREALEIADAELRRVAHLTRQALGFYKESTIPVRVCLSEVLDSAVDLLKTKITSRAATVVKNYGDRLEVMGVPGELRQVFSNLIANGLDAIDDGGILKLSLASGPDCAIVSVTDNGSGIPPSALAKIFEPFFTTKEAVGTGLGLWISKQLIDRHGGSIKVQSRTDGEHRGTSMTIILPTNGRSSVADEIITNAEPAN